MTATSYHVVLSDFVCPIWTVYRFWFGVSCLMDRLLANRIVYAISCTSIQCILSISPYSFTFNPQLCSCIHYNLHMFHFIPKSYRLPSVIYPLLSYLALGFARGCTLHLAGMSLGNRPSMAVRECMIQLYKHPGDGISNRSIHNRILKWAGERGNCTVQIEIHLNSPKKIGVLDVSHGIPNRCNCDHPKNWNWRIDLPMVGIMESLPGSCDKWSPARQATVPEGQETQRLVEGLKV